MKFLRSLIFILITMALVVLALANRQVVALKLLPFDAEFLFGFVPEVEMPLFLVILLGVLIGLLIGLLWEYLREAKYRRAMGKNAKALQSAQRELQQIKKTNNVDQDDILDLLDKN